MTSRRWLALLVILLLAYVAHSTLYHFFTVDDSFISYRYARNWANGIGPVYNPGERVDGYTNFLWVVMLAGAAIARFDLPIIAHWLGTWLGAVTVALATWLARRHPQGRDGIAAVIVAAGLGFNAIFNRSMVEGLETALFTALLLGSMARLWVETNGPPERSGESRLFHRQAPPGIRNAGLRMTSPLKVDWPIGGLLVALLTLTRPDGAMFIPLLGGWAIWRLWRRGADRARIMRWAAGFALTTGLIVGAWFVWHWLYYGAPLANTFYAKTGGPLDLRWARGINSLDILWESSGSVILLAAALLGCLFLAPAVEWWALVLLGIGGRIAFHLYSGGSFIGFLRFLIPAAPLLALIAAICVAGLWQETRQRRRLAAIPAVAMMLALVVAAMDLPRIARWRANSENAMQTLTQGHIALGKHLAETLPPDAIIAIQDAGAVPYYSGLVTIDIVGLNDARIAHLEGDLYQKTDVAYVLSRQPAAIILVSTTDPARKFTPAKWVDSAFYDDPGFQALYAHTETFMADEFYYLTVFARKK